MGDKYEINVWEKRVDGDYGESNIYSSNSIFKFVMAFLMNYRKLKIASKNTCVVIRWREFK